MKRIMMVPTEIDTCEVCIYGHHELCVHPDGEIRLWEEPTPENGNRCPIPAWCPLPADVEVCPDCHYTRGMDCACKCGKVEP